MSASLVGSEMCIRDSGDRIVNVIAIAIADRIAHRIASKSHDRITSVSYTHLTLPTICSV
eukprot:10659299-Alexandrium_andersonii.AAC.1